MCGFIVRNCNVRALGANDLSISPGWSAGWFFVPFANLVKPFVAVREIWNASDSDPRDVSASGSAPLIVTPGGLQRCCRNRRAGPVSGLRSVRRHPKSTFTPFISTSPATSSTSAPRSWSSAWFTAFTSGKNDYSRGGGGGARNKPPPRRRSPINLPGSPADAHRLHCRRSDFVPVV